MYPAPYPNPDVLHPPPPSSPRLCRLQPDMADVEEILELSATPPPLEQDANGDLSYEPAYIYSYELESYDFSYSFELEDLDSYSYEFIDSMFEEESSPYSQTYSYNFRDGEEVSVPPPSAVQSVTSLDVSTFSRRMVFWILICQHAQPDYSWTIVACRAIIFLIV